MIKRTAYWVAKVLEIPDSTVYSWEKQGIWEGVKPSWEIAWNGEKIKIDSEVVMVATTFLCDWLKMKRYPSKVTIKACQLFIDGLNHIKDGSTLYMVLGEKGKDGKLSVFTTKEEPSFLNSPDLTAFFLLNASEWLIDLQKKYQGEQENLSNPKNMFEKYLKKVA
jgi:hypothetical protein